MSQRIVEDQHVRILDTHRALHESPVCEEAPYIAQLEDERGGQFARLHRGRVVMSGPISFEITLFAVDIVEMIEKVIELGFGLIVTREVRSRFERASAPAFGREIFRGPIGHHRAARSADHAIARRQP